MSFFFIRRLKKISSLTRYNIAASDNKYNTKSSNVETDFRHLQ